MLDTVSLVVAALAYAALVYLRYEQALFLAVALLPMYLVRFSVAGIPTNALEVVIVLTAIIAGTKPHIRKKWRTAWHNTPWKIKGLVFAFLIASVVSVYVSPHLETSLGILKGWIVIPLILAWQVYALPNRHQYILGALVASGTVTAIISLLYIGSQSRLSGFYDVPNSLALYLAPIIVIAVFRNRKLPAVIMTIALLLTQSLAGALTAGLGIVGALLMKKKVVSKALIGIGLVAVVTFILFLPKINYLLTSTSSAHVRLQLWSISTQLIKENPLQGVGLGTFEPAYQDQLHKRFIAYEKGQAQKPLPEFVFRDPHNWILSFWLNTGLVGLVSFATLNIMAIKGGFTDKESSTAKIASLALIIILVFGLVDTIYWKNDLSALHLVLLALATAKS